ncbi:hypothetical protein VT84_18415 [Gemmata sp. SH-PL17]|uniref:DUF1573 domain-containing protein n=1 Tax=Gemmata sp. SH-PL17 TaxID=1630693 RepID=UPI00078B3733|nr:DUF1573 domain-containing protein [Gemmata sp. SH-PL17]AMV26378.1 hypothetical protein VT84_18415 [Gemmata sp. SH-PL17]
MNTLILLSALATGQPAPATFHSPAPVAAKGDVKAGPPLLHTFDLTNATAGTVTITKVEAGCGCLRQALATEVLPAGEKTKLALEVNTLTQPDGPNRWQATVSYKVELPGAPAQTGTLLLQLTATLSREISVTPPQVAFSAAGEVSKELVVGDKRAKPLTVLKAASSAAHLTVEIGQVANGAVGRTQPVTIKLAANAPTGHRDESVILYTDDADCPELRIPVRVLKRAAGAVTATPENVSVRLAAGQTEVSTLVQLRSPDGKAVSIAGAESDLPAVQVKCSTGSGPVATVRITVPETVAAQPGRCTVRVRMNDQGGEVSIPVSWAGKK